MRGARLQVPKFRLDVLITPPVMGVRRLGTPSMDSSVAGANFYGVLPALPSLWALCTMPRYPGFRAAAPPVMGVVSFGWAARHPAGAADPCTLAPGRTGKEHMRSEGV
jgi:hypothetical protein